MACWERWEEQIRRYERRKDAHGNRTKLDEDTKMSAFETLLPEDIENHLMLNRKRLSTYELQKEEVNMILESRIGAKIREPNLKKGIHGKSSDAMDVDAFGKGGKSKSKGKGSFHHSFTPKSAKGEGKGKGSGTGKSNATHAKKFEGICDNCGKYGHKKAECWSKQQSNTSNSKGPKGNERKGGDRKGNSKGKSKGARSFENAGEPDAEVGDFDLSPLNPTTLVSNDVSSKEEEWIKLNLDTGAAVTAFPESMAPAGLKGNGQNYKTATGELTPDQGQIRVVGFSENNKRVRVNGRVAKVHKPLLSASKCVNNGQCVWLSQGGSWLIQKTDVAVKQVERILWKHAMQGKATFIPLYEERGVYNLYVKKDKIEAVEEVSGKEEVQALTKDLKACSREELEQEIQRLRSSFQRQPRA